MLPSSEYANFGFHIGILREFCEVEYTPTLATYPQHPHALTINLRRVMPFNSNYISALKNITLKE